MPANEVYEYGLLVMEQMETQKEEWDKWSPGQ